MCTNDDYFINLSNCPSYSYNTLDDYQQTYVNMLLSEVDSILSQYKYFATYHQETYELDVDIHKFEDKSVIGKFSLNIMALSFNYNDIKSEAYDMVEVIFESLNINDNEVNK
jgi:hypothetical protein